MHRFQTRKLKEINQLIDKYQVTYDRLDYTYYLKILYLDKTINIELPSNYPFSRPIIQINDKPYFDIDEKYKKIFNKNKLFPCCLCCNSLLNNWSAMKKLVQIMDEIIKVLDFINRIKVKNMSLLISEKYSIPKCLIYEYL